MAQVTRYPSTDIAVSGTWTTPANVQADDAAIASVTVAAKNTTFVRRQGGYGFDGVIPVGSTINNVWIEVEHRVSGTGGIANLENRTKVGGVANTVNTDDTEPTVLTARVYDETAKRTWTRANLLDGTLETEIQARSGNNATSINYEWDYVRVRVDYTLPAPSLVSATMENADRNYETFEQDITLTFSEAVEIIPAPSVGDTIAGLTAEIDFNGTEDPVKYVSGNGTTTWKVRIVPVAGEIFSSTGTVLIDYIQATGGIVTVNNGTEIAAFTDTLVTNNLSTIIWERIKNKTGSNLNAVEVRYALYHRNTDTITDADWMTLEQKGTLTTTADGIVSFAYTGSSSPGTSGGNKYLSILHPHSAPTESMIWFTRVR